MNARDAAIAGTTVHHTNTGAYPAKLSDMTGATPAELTLPTGVTVNHTGLIASNRTWTLTMTAGASGAATTFTCS